MKHTKLPWVLEVKRDKDNCIDCKYTLTCPNISYLLKEQAI